MQQTYGILVGSAVKNDSCILEVNNSDDVLPVELLTLTADQFASFTLSLQRDEDDGAVEDDESLCVAAYLVGPRTPLSFGQGTPMIVLIPPGHLLVALVDAWRYDASAPTTEETECRTTATCALTYRLLD